MAEPTPRGIQATLFDYFQDTEYFDLQEANELLLEHQQRDINAESIRARIYEGIDKGLFERVGKGLYTVTRKDEQGRENTCLLINGDGRDLSMFADNSLDAIVTDHPYSLKASLKGGNRNFADYELFQYNEQDFLQKQRILRPGCFCVEFLPEENGDNYEYLFRVKDMARKAGLEYYASVPWKKQGFVANTGRKAKDTENIVFFTKGRARELRPDAKKDKQYESSRTIIEFKDYIPGSTTVHASEMGGLGTSYETKIEPVRVDIRVSVAKEDADKVKVTLEEAWDNAVIYSCEDSPLDKDNGGTYTYEELLDMPVQEYMLAFLEAKNFSFIDLSFGPENIFDASTQVLVNPTNLLGPMGAGLAKDFKEKFPLLEETYKESCRQRQFCSGAKGFKSPSGDSREILISESRALFEGNLFLMGANPDMNRPAILCFPTKRDWKDSSDLSLIESGLKTFVQNYKHFNIKSITFPKLGCGLGGLDWEKEVKPLMQKYLGSLPDLDVQICGDTLREDKQEHFMSGARGMLPTQFEIPPTRKSEKIHQSEKPLMLLEEILSYVTLPGETALDQFAGSGVLGEAALKTGRNSILIEKDAESFQKMSHRIQALGTIQAITPAAQTLLSIGKDALFAREAFERTGDRDILTNFVNSYEIHPEILLEGQSDICHDKATTQEQQDAAVAAFESIEELDLRANDLEHTKAFQLSQGEHIAEETPQQQTPKVLECSSRGDRRFSALFATVKIKGKEQSIEEWYQNAKRTSDGKKAGKGKPFDHIIDPFTGDMLPASEATSLYQGLWVTYLNNNPDLVSYAKGFDEFHDMFKRKNTVNCHADIISAYIKNESAFVDAVKGSQWYQNMLRKHNHSKPRLQEQIIAAAEKRDAKNSAQLSLFGQTQNYHSGNIISGR